MAQRWLEAAMAAVAVVASLCLPGPARAAVELTATETAWLQAALPVLNFARERRLPLDIIVQPQPTPGQTPLGMAFVDGRCKLVLSMRGNAQAQAVLDDMPAELVGAIVESLAAHELAHCWRHLQQDWGQLPPGLRALPLSGQLSIEQVAVLEDMWRERREEAYADLVGLAWTLQHQRAHYPAVHAWYVRLRAQQALDTGPHDTRVWVQMAADPVRFPSAPSIFERAFPLWVAGLLAAQ